MNQENELIETERPALSPMALENSGDHHQVKVAYDPSTGKLAAGGIYNFSDHAGVMLQTINGKTDGTIVHSGDTHNLQINVSDDGSFSGSYTDKKGLERSIEGDKATLKNGEIPKAGISITGDHHRVDLKTGPDGKISGSLESLNTAVGNFKINLDQGKVSGTLSHVGENHQTSITIGHDGWGANIEGKKGDLSYGIGIQKGSGEVKATAGLKLRF